MAKHILIVDDNMASLKQIGAILATDYRVSLAKSGSIALRICERQKPDMILLDINMSGMNGFDTIARFKRYPSLSHIPIIFMTSEYDEAAEVRALESGAMDFITKPPNKSILKYRIELHLQFSAYKASLVKTVTELEDSIVTSFADLIDRKDLNTGNHLLHTGKYVNMLGNKLVESGKFAGRLTEKDIEMIVRATPFHDIGKISISDGILMKPGTLTEDEYDTVKQHTIIGAQVIETIYKRTPALQYLECARLIALSHHERYDGSGYPHGLSGENIPLCARITTVANVYNACVTDRVYRKALSHEEACDVILDGKGTEFDPLIVETFELCCSSFAKLDAETNTGIRASAN